MVLTASKNLSRPMDTASNVMEGASSILHGARRSTKAVARTQRARKVENMVSASTGDSVRKYNQPGSVRVVCRADTGKMRNDFI